MPSSSSFREQGPRLTFSSASQDTVTGFLLAGAGHKDFRQNSNFLIVDSSKYSNLWRDGFSEREAASGSGSGSSAPFFHSID